MSISLIPVIFGQVRAVASAVATAIANIAAVKADTAGIAAVKADTAAIATARNEIAAARNEIAAARQALYDTELIVRDQITNHVTWAVQAYPSGGVKNVQHIAATVNFTATNGGLGGSSYVDISIASVNLAKAFITNTRAAFGSSTPFWAVYRFISATVVRVEVFGGYAGSSIVVPMDIVEFN